jgi:iron-sulfur cluster repair protein YtfE (RIC family)
MIKSIKAMTPGATLAQIISADPNAGRLLKAIGLDIANYGQETLQSVCQQRKWSEVEVLGWIKKNCFAQNKDKVNEAETVNSDVGKKLNQWCGTVEKKKMARTESLLSEISEAFPRVHQIHGNQYPWLKNMQEPFAQFDELIKRYYTFEKKRFFPLVEKLIAPEEEVSDGTVHHLKRCSDIIEKDQKRLQQYINTAQTKGDQLKNPDGACSTMRILNQNFKMLFKNIEEQFKIEKEEILPGVDQKIEEILRQ